MRFNQNDLHDGKTSSNSNDIKHREISQHHSMTYVYIKGMTDRVAELDFA